MSDSPALTGIPVRAEKGNQMSWNELLGSPLALAKALEGRKLIDRGGYAALYEVNGCAVKIGAIEKGEAERQQWACETYQAALPVLAYAHRVEVTEAVTREACPRHGGEEEGEWGWECYCCQPLDVLVMPLARPAPRKVYYSPEAKTLIATVSNALRKKFDRYWDERPANLAIYEGRLVLLDFGEVSM